MAPQKGVTPSHTDEDQRPFGLPWLDSCYQETMLPNGPWHNQIMPVLCEAFAERISKQFNVEERKQMLFELLGVDFVRKYFPEETYNPQIVSPPNITAVERKKLHHDASNWLRNVLNLAAADLKCQRPKVADEKGEEQSESMTEFLQHSRYIFLKGMDRHLYLQEKHVVDAWGKAQHIERTMNEERRDEILEAQEVAKLREEHIRLRGHAYPRGILKTSQSRASSVWTEVPENDPQQNADTVLGTGQTPPVFWGMQSNTLGRAVLAILKRDPRRFPEVVSHLHGNQLPGSLRSYIWLDVLLKREREKLNDVNVEKIVRERFGKAVSRGVGDLGLRRATHSPISGLIDNTVIEVYDSTPGMRMFVSQDKHLREAARTLNILFTYDRTYEPYLVHWLFPLQLCFRDPSSEGDHVYELAMYLDLLNASCYPTWPQIFGMAETVMERLQSCDPDYHNHLKQISLVEPSVNPKEFLIQLIHEERSKAEEIMTLSGQAALPTDARLLTDPLIFLRKWMGEGFVSVLDTQAAVYLWDQFFMQLWHKKAVEDACLALLMLLRHKFMAAENYSEMKNVFIKDPSALYTKDIQQAWVHIQKGEDMKAVPEMNRQRPLPKDPGYDPQPETRKPLAKLPHKRKPPTDKNRLTAAVIDNIKLTLYLSDTVVNSTSWLIGFDLRRITLKCALYFGSIQIFAELGHVEPSPKAEPTTTTNNHNPNPSDSASNKTSPIMAVFPGEKFNLPSVDLSQYDVEKEMGGSPYVVIKVEYLPPPASASQTDLTRTQSASKHTIGLAKIDLYKQEHAGWQLTEGPVSSSVLDSSEWKGVHGDSGSSSSGVTEGLVLSPSCLDCMVHKTTADETLPPDLSSQPPYLPQPSPHPSLPSSTEDASSASVPGLEDPFDLYVDAIVNIPDNATVVKVTGRFIKIGDMEPLEDILALPELESSARSQSFKYKLTVNEDGRQASLGMLLLLRAYTVDVDTGELVVIGSRFSDVFYEDTEELQMGSHRRALHTGMPRISDVEELTSDCHDDSPRVPACSILFRLLKHSQGYVEAPPIGEYAWDDSALDESEAKLEGSFTADKTFPQRVKDMAIRMQIAANDRNTEKDLLSWTRDRLDPKIHLPENQAAKDLDLTRMVTYRIDTGVNVCISQVFGVPEGSVVQCYGYISPGQLAKQMTPTKEGYGNPKENFSTGVHDLDSLQKSQQWTDDPSTLHPHSDPNTVLVLRLFTINAAYKPSANNDGGTIISSDKKVLSLTEYGWTVVPVFNDVYISPGEYHVPVFRGPPDSSVISAMQTSPPHAVIKSNKREKKSIHDGTSVVVKVWDAHFTDIDKLPYDLERNESLIEAAGKTDSCRKAEKETKGKKMAEFILQTLDSKTKKLGLENNPKLEAEKENYQRALKTATQNLMESFFQ